MYKYSSEYQAVNTMHQGTTQRQCEHTNISYKKTHKKKLSKLVQSFDTFVFFFLRTASLRKWTKTVRQALHTSVSRNSFKCSTVSTTVLSVCTTVMALW